MNSLDFFCLLCCIVKPYYFIKYLPLHLNKKKGRKTSKNNESRGKEKTQKRKDAKKKRSKKRKTQDKRNRSTQSSQLRPHPSSCSLSALLAASLTTGSSIFSIATLARARRVNSSLTLAILIRSASETTSKGEKATLLTFHTLAAEKSKMPFFFTALCFLNTYLGLVFA